MGMGNLFTKSCPQRETWNRKRYQLCSCRFVAPGLKNLDGHGRELRKSFIILWKIMCINYSSLFRTLFLYLSALFLELIIINVFQKLQLKHRVMWCKQISLLICNSFPSSHITWLTFRIWRSIIRMIYDRLLLHRFTRVTVLHVKVRY